MPARFAGKLPGLRERWEDYRHLFREVRVPPRTVLLREGQIARKILFVREGCLRATFQCRGKEVTFQFFFENDAVASIESFRTQQPSPISIVSIEPTVLIVLEKSGFETLLRDFPDLKDLMIEMLFARFSHYSSLFLSYLRDTPAERYANLVKNHPHILQRVPLRFIASYLGITPVSLSRIRGKSRAAFLNKR